MPSNPSLQGTSFLALFLLFPLFSTSSPLVRPDIAPIQSLPLTPSPPLPATIPAYPEQSNAAGCPLQLPADLFHTVKAACGGVEASGQLQRGRCCPVLAAWLYAAYSSTALGRAATAGAAAESPAASAFEMPLLPDDSETCEGDLEKAMRVKGMELARPNASCDLVYCYCGIRLHSVSCPAAFSISRGGKVAGGDSVRRLERECRNGSPGLGGCNRCLESINQLSGDKIGTGSKSKSGKGKKEEEEEERVRKMHNRECELMGFTWLLAKNTSAYFHTVSMVLRAIMMTTDGSHPRSCSLLSSDGLPLAVDSSQLSDPSASTALLHSSHLVILSLCLLCMLLLALSAPTV